MKEHVMLKAILLVIGTAFLTGCSAFETAQSPPAQPGQTFVLEHAIDILPQQARRFIQHQQLRTRSELDERYPHCRIEVRTLRDQIYRIEPDHFRITRVRNDVEAIAHNKSPLMLASITLPAYLAFADDGPAEVMELVMLYLDSPKQPDVLRLVCAGKRSDGNPMDYPDALRPDLARINQLMSGWGTVR